MTASSGYAHPQGGAERSHTHEVAPTAGVEDVATLRFEILDGDGRVIPGRLTFTDDQQKPVAVFTNTQADPDQYALRRSVLYTLSGSGSITVEPGTYTVWVSRGSEYSIASRRIEFRANEEVIWTPTIEHELDTTGWVSGDFHLHTLTYSGHGDSSMPERIISLIGEHVEFAVATDHNHNTDYEPTMEALGVPDAMRAVVGNEVSTPIGHFNAFPLDADAPLIPSRIRDAHLLFSLIRANENEFGTVPVVQVNHPRWGDIDYFGGFGLDPVSGHTDARSFSYDFDAVEIFNENEGWGYIDADERDLPLGSGSFSVLRDWFNLLNLGHRIAAVGNSDSHDVESELAGWPRNYIASSTDEPSKIDPAEVAANIRAKRVYTTYGPIVDFGVNGVPMGGDARATRSDNKQTVDVTLRIQVPSWMSCDRAMIVVNGQVVRTIEIPTSDAIVRLDTAERIDLNADSWISVLVEGDTPLRPIVHDQGRPIYPWAVLNPVWVDADGDGVWTSPAERMSARVAELDDEALVAELAGSSSADMVLAIIAASESGRPYTGLLKQGLAHHDRQVRLAALGAVEKLALNEQASAPRALMALKRDARDLLATAGDDQHLRVRAMRALRALGDDSVRDQALRIVSGAESGGLRAGFADDIIAMLGGGFVQEWSVAGYFAASQPGALRTVMTEAEVRPHRDEYASGKDGSPVTWIDLAADDRGYVDLRRLAGLAGMAGAGADATLANNAISTARVWFEADGSDIGFSFGADDASRVMLNGEVIYEEHSNHSANPLQHTGVLKTKAGVNELIVSVENGDGGYGFYFRIFDDAVLGSVTNNPPEGAIDITDAAHDTNGKAGS